MTQTWTIHLGKAGSTTITYDPGEGDFVTVNGMQLRVRHLQPSTSFSSFSERRFFTNYTGYQLEFAPRKRGMTGKFTGAKKLYEMKVDGKLVEEEKKNFRDMGEGSYVIAVGGGGGEGGGGNREDWSPKKLDGFGQEIACVGLPVNWDGVEGDEWREDERVEERGSEVELVERVSGGSVGEEEKGGGEEEDENMNRTNNGGGLGGLPKGVERDERRGFYTAGITVGGKYRELGTFGSIEEAQRVYQEADLRFRRK